MAPRVHSDWLEHGWWITSNGMEKPTLWITEFPVEEGRYWTPLATSRGVIESFAGTAEGGMTVSVSNTESVLERYKLRKKLLLSQVPAELLLVISPMNGLKALAKFWRTMPEEVKIQREARVQKFNDWTPEQALEARVRYREIRSYEDLRNTDPVAAEARAPPREPEDTDETYRLLATPMNRNWIPVPERSRKRTAFEAENVEDVDEGGVSQRQRVHRQRLLSTSTDDVHEPLADSDTEQHEEATIQRSAANMLPSETVEVERESYQPQHNMAETVVQSEGVLPPIHQNADVVEGPTTITEVGCGSRAPRVHSANRTYRSRVVGSRENVTNSIEGRGRTSGRGRGIGRGRGVGRGYGVGSGRGSSVMRTEDNIEEQRRRRTPEVGTEEEQRRRTRSAVQRHHQRVTLQGPPPQGNDGEDEIAEDDSSEEEQEQEPRRASVRKIGKPTVVFPTETQYKDGYIWGHDVVFHANIDSIRNVVNAETNHRVLMDWRVNEMYERLKGSDADGVSAITLRPIAYVYESTNDKGEVELVEVSFSHEGAAQEFKFAFMKHNPENPSILVSTTRTRWLQQNIVWEPVDGQHIVAACKRAQKENEEGKMSDEEYKKLYATRKAKFVVYNNPQFYIEASVRINAREFDRTFFTTYYENIIKLRDIWKACGRPSAASRIDDEYRAKALTMAASALHWSQGLPKHMSLRELSKKMIDYTRHAWNEDEESYKAILKVCRDYEEGKLFFSKKSEDKWKKMAREQNLDVTVDGNPQRKRMEKTWFRPLSRVSNETYVHVVKRMAAKDVVNGKRGGQQYYFNNATSVNPPKGTVAYAVDHLQRKDAVRNQIRYLMVQARDENPQSMDEFFAINVSKYGDERGRQFNLMGKTLNTDTKTLWSSPTVKTVQSLSSYVNLIPAFVKQHLMDIKAGRRGYAGYGRDVEDVANARWDWQVTISTMQNQEREALLHVRCRGRFFEDEYVELGKPCLWVFDCRRGGSEGVDEEWSNDDYSKVLEQIQKWMSLIVRWTAIFLFPPGTEFDEAMKSKMALPESLHCLRGSWIFKPQTVSSYVRDLRHGEQRVCTVQAIGDIAIIMQYPRESGPMENLPRSTEYLDVIFQDSWSTEVMPRVADKVERTPMELKRMVQMFLPRNWGLVTLGITMALPGILETGFIGNEVIIMEEGTTRTQFVYNTLQLMYGDKMVMVNSMSTAAERRSSQMLSPSLGPSEEDASVPRGRRGRVVRSSSDSSDTEERTEVNERKKQKGKEIAVDSGASSTSNGGSDSNQAQSDDLPSGGRSLGSADTDAESDAHGEQVDLLEMEVDPTYVPVKNTSDMENEELEGVETDVGEIEGTPRTTEPMSTLSPYNFLDSMNFLEENDGYFYDREHVRYVRLGNEGHYTYERVSSILEASTLSPTLSEGVSSPIASAMVDRALQYASPPPLSPIGGPSVNEEIGAVREGEVQDLTQASAQVSEATVEGV